MIDLKKAPTANDLKWFTRLAPPFFFILGIFISWRHATTGGQVLTTACWLLALVSLLLALFSPRGLRRFYKTWLLITYPIGWVVTHLVLGFVFFVFFMPLGFFLRCFGHDPLQLRSRGNIPTYWRRRPAQPTNDRYFQQF